LVITALVALAAGALLLGIVLSAGVRPSSVEQPLPESAGTNVKIEALIPALNDPDVSKQQQAAEALRQTGKPAGPLLRKWLAVANDQLKIKIQQLLAELEGSAAPTPVIAAPPAPAAPPRLPSHPVRKRDWHREGWTLPEALLEQINEGDPFNPLRPLPLVNYELLVKWAKHNPARWQDLLQYLDSVPFHRREEHLQDMRAWQIGLTDLMKVVGLKCTEENEGLRVIEVSPSSIAERLGMTAGDLLVKANGVAIRHLGDAKRAFLEAIHRGDAFFEVEIIRNKQSVTLSAPSQ
jgi:hypothetical protein